MIETVKINEQWLELPVITGEVITIQAICKEREYVEIYVGDESPKENLKGIPVRAFENIRFKNLETKVFARNVYGEATVSITDSVLGGL